MITNAPLLQRWMGTMQTGQGVRKATRGSPRWQAGRPRRLGHYTLTPCGVVGRVGYALREGAKSARSDLGDLLEELGTWI